jgi:hypothetical protein
MLVVRVGLIHPHFPKWTPLSRDRSHDKGSARPRCSVTSSRLHLLHRPAPPRPLPPPLHDRPTSPARRSLPPTVEAAPTSPHRLANPPTPASPPPPPEPFTLEASHRRRHPRQPQNLTTPGAAAPINPPLGIVTVPPPPPRAAPDLRHHHRSSLLWTWSTPSSDTDLDIIARKGDTDPDDEDAELLDGPHRGHVALYAESATGLYVDFSFLNGALANLFCS